jgi:hypothetical protein
MEEHFKGYSVQHTPRDDNNEADKLAKAAARNQELPPDVFFEIIREPSSKDSRAKIVNVVETPDWRAEIMAYLRGHYEPQDELEEKSSATFVALSCCSRRFSIKLRSSSWAF